MTSVRVEFSCANGSDDSCGFPSLFFQIGMNVPLFRERGTEMTQDMNILVYTPNEPETYAELIRKAGYTSVHAASTPEEAKEKLKETEVIIAWQFPLHLLGRPEARSVKWIQSLGAGVDDLVRSPSIHEQVVITRIVDQFGVPMSEYVFAQLLHLYQDVERSRAAQQEKRWEPFVTELLHGKTIGIAGLGSIGKEIIKKARAFDMAIHGLSFSGKEAHLVDRHFGPDQWLDFVKELDILVLILPLTEQTCHVVNREVLLAMKPSACLVNIGRGHLIAEEELIYVLRSGHLRAAILDVFQQEPLPESSPLWQLPNVYVTPHMSGPSTQERIGQYILDNLARYGRGEALHGIVNRKAGY